VRNETGNQIMTRASVIAAHGLEQIAEERDRLEA
jgi:hypothetical protein